MRKKLSRINSNELKKSQNRQKGLQNELLRVIFKIFLCSISDFLRQFRLFFELNKYQIKILRLFDTELWKMALKITWISALMDQIVHSCGHIQMLFSTFFGWYRWTWCVHYAKPCNFRHHFSPQKQRFMILFTDATISVNSQECNELSRRSIPFFAWWAQCDQIEQ